MTGTGLRSAMGTRGSTATYTTSASVTGISSAPRVAITSMCIVIDVRPTRTGRVLNLTTSPTSTGILNSQRLNATVTNTAAVLPWRRKISRRAAMAPAWSM